MAEELRSFRDNKGIEGRFENGGSEGRRSDSVPGDSFVTPPAPKASVPQDMQDVHSQERGT